MMVEDDGLSGHLHDEIAAQVAVQYFAGAFQRNARPLLAAAELLRAADGERTPGMPEERAARA